MLLAVQGVYSVLAFTVEQRRREFGVRMALGADASRLVSLVLGRGMRLAAAGLVLGLAGALLTARALEALLFEVRSTDPLTYVAGGALLLFAAFAAGYVPARRAASMEPAAALRQE